jgi:hypothetical protein
MPANQQLECGSAVLLGGWNLVVTGAGCVRTRRLAVALCMAVGSQQCGRGADKLHRVSSSKAREGEYSTRTLCRV